MTTQRDKLGTPPEGFRAATWNVFNGTPVDVLDPILTGLLDDGVNVLMMQECQGPDIRQWLMQRRMRFHRFPHGQCVVAWHPGAWQCLNFADVVLSATRYRRVGGQLAPGSESPVVILADRWGRSLTVTSYHTPAGVQLHPGGGVSPHVPLRTQNTEESMTTLRDLAAESVTTGFLAGGDDNFDERRGVWSQLLRKFTGLKVVQAPRATHGPRKRGSRLDDFRVKGLTVGDGSVRNGGGDHRIHVRSFSW